MNSLSRVFHSFRPSMASRFSTSGPQNLSSPKAKLRGVVFDMDGTLTVPVIDFSAMYKAALGEDYASIKSSSSLGVDILQHIDSWSPDRQQKAYEIIADFERRGLEKLQIMPGAKELCEYLDARQIRRGLITRNVKAAVDLFHLRFGMTFDPALSREFRPYKPDPAPLLSICSVWAVRPDEVIMVGDSLRDDVTCGRRAGAFTCLLDEKKSIPLLILLLTHIWVKQCCPCIFDHIDEDGNNLQHSLLSTDGMLVWDIVWAHL